MKTLGDLFVVGITLLLLTLAVCSGSQITLYSQTAGLAYDPTNGVLYANALATGNGLTNCLVQISPLNGAITAVTNLRVPPGVLAISPENRSLYLALPSQQAVCRYDLNNKQLGPAFNVGGTVKNMVVMPGQPERLAVIRNEDLALRVYENGALLPGGVGGDFINYVSLVCAGAEGRLYGYNLNTTENTFYRLAVNSNGVSLVDASIGPFPLPGANMQFANGKLYAGAGWIADPESKVLLGQFAVTNFGEPVVACDLARNRVYVADTLWPNSPLYAFEPQTFQTMGTSTILNTTWSAAQSTDQAYVHDFLRWGTNGLACRTADAVLILQGSLIPAGPANDLALTLTTTNSVVTTGQMIAYTIVVTNLGPATATNPMVRFAYPAGTRYVSASNNRGSATASRGAVSCTISNLPRYAAATIRVSVSEQSTNTAALLATAEVTAPADPQQGNNVAVLLTTANWRTNLDEVNALTSLTPIDSAYCPGAGRFFFIFDQFAGGLANTLVGLDPASGVFDTPVYLPGDPQGIIVGEGNNTLDVAMASFGDVRAISLPSGSVDNEYSPSLWQQIQSRNQNVKNQADFAFTVSAEMSLSNNAVLGQFPTLLFNYYLFEPDIAAGRFYQLALPQRLRVFDTHTFRLIQDVTFPIPAWSYASLARWGSQGFLLRAAEGIVTLRSSLVPFAAPADLSAGLAFTPAQASTKSVFTLTASVTNFGPALASNVTCQVQLPGQARLLSAKSSAGTLQSNASTLTLSLNRLNTLSNAVVTATLQFSNAGLYIATASVSSQSIDTNSGNDVALCSALATASDWPGIDSAVVLPLSVNDLIYEPVSKQLYASLGSAVGAFGNSIVAIDPATGLVRSFWPAGSEPGKLAASADGQYLYVTTGGVVNRFRLEDHSLDQSYATSPAPAQSDYVADIAVQPGHSDTVALLKGISGMSPSTTRLVVYRNGQALSNTLDAFDIQVLGFSDDGTTLFGYGNQDSDFLFSVINVSSNGATLAKRYGGYIAGFGESFRQEGGLIFGTTGIVFDPITPMPHGLLPGVSQFGGIAPHTVANRAYGMVADGTNALISSYDLTRMTVIGQESIPAATDYPGSLQRSGENRLAYKTASSVVVLQSSLVSAGPVADLGVSFTAVPNGVNTNQPFEVTLSITNAGPAPAGSCLPAVVLPAGLILNASTGGSWLQGNTWYPSSPVSLAAGQSKQWTLTLTSTNRGLKFLQAFVLAEATDADSTNDIAACFIPTGLGVATGEYDAFPLPARSLFYSPARARLYAALPAGIGSYGNSVVEIDPATSTVRGPLFIGSEPVALAGTDDGHYLYVSIFGLGGMQCVNLDTWTVESQFPVGPEVVPAVALAGMTNSVAISHGVDAAIFANGKRTSYQSAIPVAELVRGEGTRIYGYDSSLPIMPIVLLSAAGDSLSTAGEWDGQFFTSGVDLRFAAGHLFSNRGDVLDPERQTVLGRFPGFAQVNAFAPETDGSKLYTFTNGILHVWETTNYQMLATANLSFASQTTSDLCRWGSDGLACLADGLPIWFRASAIGNPLPPQTLAIKFGQLSAAGLPLSFPGKAGHRYHVDYSPTLSPPNWRTLTTNLAGGDTTISFTQPLAEHVGFLRIVEESSF